MPFSDFFSFSIGSTAVALPILLLSEPIKQMGTACNLGKECQRKILSTKLFPVDLTQKSVRTWAARRDVSCFSLSHLGQCSDSNFNYLANLKFPMRKEIKIHVDALCDNNTCDCNCIEWPVNLFV